MPSNRLYFRVHRWILTYYLEAIVIGLGLIGFLSILFGLLTTDESVFYLIGREIRQGALPYQDLWDHKGPPIYLLTFIASFFGPATVQVGRLLAFAFPLFGCFGLLRMAGVANDWRLNLFTGCLGASVFASLGRGIMTEHLEAGAILWALAFLVAIHTKEGGAVGRLSFLAGLSSGTAVIIRLPALIFVPIIASFFVLRLSPGRWRRGLLNLFLFTAGTVLPVGLVVILLKAAGLFDNMVNVYIGGNLAYARASIIPIAQAGRLLFYQVVPGTIALNVLYLVLGLPGLWQIGRRIKARYLPFLFLLTAVVEALMVRFGFHSHYWSVMFWLLVPGAAYTLFGWLTNKIQRPNGGWQLSLGLLFLLAALPASQPLAARLQPEYQSVARDLGAYVQPGESLWVGGTTGGALYFYTGAHPASNFIYTGAAAELAFEVEPLIASLEEKWPLVVIGPDWHDNGQFNSRMPIDLEDFLTVNYQFQEIIEDQATGKHYLVFEKK